MKHIIIFSQYVKKIPSVASISRKATHILCFYIYGFYSWFRFKTLVVDLYLPVSSGYPCQPSSADNTSFTKQPPLLGINDAGYTCSCESGFQKCPSGTCRYLIDFFHSHLMAFSVIAVRRCRECLACGGISALEFKVGIFAST